MLSQITLSKISMLKKTLTPTLERLPVIKTEPNQEDKENKTTRRKSNDRYRPDTEERFKRKFEWGSYYTKYNIPKSSTKCVFDGCNFTVSNLIESCVVELRALISICTSP